MQKEHSIEHRFSLKELFRKSRAYLDTRLRILKLKSAERVSALVAPIVGAAVKVVLGLFMVFFLSLALGYYLGEVFGRTSLGFLAVGALYLLLLGLAVVLRIPIERLLTDLSIRRIMQNWDEQREEKDEKKT